jgi:hypothetical protein
MRDIRNWYKLLEGTGLVANDAGPGVAQGALSANVTWCPFYAPPFSTLLVSGTLDPDATGDYTYTGYYDSHPYFTNTTGYILWFQYSGNSWLISDVLGDQGARGWLAWSTVITGTYAPYGTATGDAVVTCDYTIPYDQKGVITTATASRIITPAAAGFPANAGSIEMLVRPYWTYTDGLVHFFWDTYGGNNRRFLLAKQAGNNTELFTDSTSRGSVTFAWTAHTLYHVVLNWGTNTLYINNTLVKTYTPATLGTGASTLYIGDHYTTAARAFNGIIYYFIARDVALTLAELTTFNAFFQTQYIPQIA